MHLYQLTLQQASQITHTVHGNFTGTKQQVRLARVILPPQPPQLSLSRAWSLWPPAVLPIPWFPGQAFG